MKVLMILTRGDTVAGAQVHVRDLSEGLVKQGHSVHVLVGEGKPFQDTLSNVGVESTIISCLQRDLSIVNDIKALLSIYRAIGQHKPDLIATHSSKAGFLGRIAALLRSTPAIFTAHGWSFADGINQTSRRIYKSLEKALLPISSAVICVCKSDREFAKEQGLSGEKLHVIHNGVKDNIEHIRPRTGPMVLTMVGRIDHQKDHPTLLRALELLKHRNKLPADFTCQLIGSGELEQETRQKTKELGLDCVQFLGTRKDIPTLLAQSSAFVLASNWEGFPLSTLEAMRAGLPIIVSDVGGAAEAVDGNGYVIARGDHTALANCIESLLEDSQTLHSFGSRSRELYEQNFDAEAMIEKTLSLYQIILKNKTTTHFPSSKA